MVAEAVPLSVNSDNNLRITFSPKASSGLSVSILTGGTSKDFTYSLKTFNLTETQDSIDDKRFSLAQNLSRPGRKTFKCEIQYVFGDAGDVVAKALVEGTEGHLTNRYSIPNATAWTAAQVADYITFKAGSQRKDPAVENGVQTITQELFITDVVLKDQVLVA